MKAMPSFQDCSSKNKETRSVKLLSLESLFIAFFPPFNLELLSSDFCFLLQAMVLNIGGSFLYLPF